MKDFETYLNNHNIATLPLKSKCIQQCPHIMSTKAVEFVTGGVVVGHACKEGNWSDLVWKAETMMIFAEI